MQSSDFLLHNLEVQLDVKRVLTCVIKITTFVYNSTAMNDIFLLSVGSSIETSPRVH